MPCTSMIAGAAQAEMGYRPDPAAKLLREHHSRMLGIVFDAGDPFHADLPEAIYPAAERCGYEIVLGARVPARSERRAVVRGTTGPAPCGAHPTRPTVAERQRKQLIQGFTADHVVDESHSSQRAYLRRDTPL